MSGAANEQNVPQTPNGAGDTGAPGVAPAEQTPRLEPQLEPLLGKSLQAIERIVREGGFPAFRAKQIYNWLYRQGISELDEMKNLPAPVLQWLRARYNVGHAEVASIRVAADESEKMLFRLHDGKVVESVLMLERDWKTLCISSQVGCAVGCTFCMTGFGGFRRHMTAGEILSQVLHAKRQNGGELPRNLVFMGMGEPMLNLDAVLTAIEILIDPNGIGMAPRRVTVSTSGILPGLKRLGEADLGVNVAVSLNASNNQIRDEIMPINKAYPIEDLLEVCRNFPLRSRRLIMFEYVLLGGFNDSIKNARELTKLLHRLQCKINLIPWNPDPHLPFKRPAEDAVRSFQTYLLDRNFRVSVRYSKGVDIGAACGQLAGHWEAEQKALAS